MIQKLTPYLVFIPEGMTNQLQVIDFVVNKSFKDSLRKKCKMVFENVATFLPPKGMKEDHQSLCVVGVWYPEKLCSWTEKIVAF